jgi:hypothetical protein
MHFAYSKCAIAFPYKQGWMGADAAYSIALDKHKSLWFFGDTFIQNSQMLSRINSRLIHNSIGVFTNQKSCEMHYYWGNQTEKAKAFFTTKENNTFYWPKAGVYTKENVYLFLTKIKKISDNALGFKTVGASIAVIDNPKQPPSKWHVKIIPLTWPEGIEIASTVVKHNNELLIFCSDAVNQKTFIIKTELSKLANPKWSTLTADNQWVHRLKVDKALSVFNHNITEMSVFKTNNHWLAVYSLFPGILTIKSAISLKGPWTLLRPIVNLRPPSSDDDVFCYAAKAHQLEEQGDYFITYVCNSFNFDHLINDLSIYKPILLKG